MIFRYGPKAHSGLSLLGYPVVLIAILRPRRKKAGISRSLEETVNSSSQLVSTGYWGVSTSKVFGAWALCFSNGIFLPSTFDRVSSRVGEPKPVITKIASTR